MFDRAINQHKHPVTMVFHFIAFLMGGYGLWLHNWSLIIGAVIVACLGHLFSWGNRRVNSRLSSKQSKPSRRKRRK
jgi:hypothetical protein